MKTPWNKDKKMISINRPLIKKALIITAILFAIGLTMKIVDKSLATWHWTDLIDKRDHSKKGQGWEEYNSGASDQAIAWYIGWPLVLLKIVIYGIALMDLTKALKSDKIREDKLKSIAWSFVRLAIGLTIGESITVWLTERNASEHNARVIYSYVSPVVSIIFATSLAIYFFNINSKVKRAA